MVVKGVGELCDAASGVLFLEEVEVIFSITTQKTFAN